MGDTFTLERCYAKGVGVTRFSFESAWGDFALELTRALARPALP